MLYLLDVDGTLIESYFRKGAEKTVENYALVTLLPHRREKIQQLADSHDARFALVTNQAGVAMGYQTPQDVHRKMALVAAELGFFYGSPVSLHVCMHHMRSKLPEWQMDPCPRRKPEPGMLLEAIDSHRVGFAECLMVGDMETDEEAAARARVPYMDAADFFRAVG